MDLGRMELVSYPLYLSLFVCLRLVHPANDVMTYVGSFSRPSFPS
jgi:hypothetical protein